MNRSNSEQVDGQAGLRNRNITQGTEDGSSRKIGVRKMPSFPTSVFAAGTAKRTAKMLKMKTSLASVDEELERRTSKSAGTETKFINILSFFNVSL